MTSPGPGASPPDGNGAAAAPGTPADVLGTVAGLLREAGPVVLLAHVSPDADALGSALAVAHALRELGRPCQVSWGDDPFEVPRALRALPGAGPEDGFLVPPSRLAASGAVTVAFDCARADRLGVLAPVLDSSQVAVAFDHHSSHEPFAAVRLVDPAAAATTVLAAGLIDALGVELTPAIAACLYAGLVTDTGSFRFSNTRPDTLRFAARLLDVGFDHSALVRSLVDDVPASFLPVLGAALERVVLDGHALAGAGLVTAVVPGQARRDAGLAVDDVTPVLDTVRRAEEADVACVLYEDDPGTWRVSLRSKGRVDVSRAAVSLGGGGHRAAAGLTAHGSADDVLGRVREALEAAL
ncbi:DHH family phosphoesterase [Motilibacter aurantiacus]|uniref:DHH family phosphoesterase n=1 Tax=Motilibacter aurantiacus TaxID=2714955 RepID=UPI00140CAEC9|nr:DHH family phosphoesterase [Motilibacter aurantiacus]NHC44596.1 bifunctional oligoribonuclease/PAP phosphatase NrnA [Motilibacter aurantiacus]